MEQRLLNSHHYVYYPLWRGKQTPVWHNERWFLETRPERVNDYNEWIVYIAEPNHALQGPVYRCQWWGKWTPPGAPLIKAAVDGTRNFPWGTVSS